MHICLCVPAPKAGQRLDSFLANQLENVSRSSIQKWIEAGHVTVGGSSQKPSYSVREGEEIRVATPAPEPVELQPEAIPLRLVYEDDLLVVIDKPAGLVVHPGAGNRSGTLANALVYHFSQLAGGDRIRPGIVHRLDRATSGLLVVAKNERTHEMLSRQFKERTVEKEYLSLVYGHLEPGEGRIDIPIGRHPRARTRMSTRGRKLRQAISDYRVERLLQGFSLVQVKLLTGRTHQIRVHFEYLGHPVVGDATYGRRRVGGVQDPVIQREIRSLNRHFLHAARLSFTHPVRQERLKFESELPRELTELLRLLGA